MANVIRCFLPGEPPTCTKQQRKYRVVTPKGGKAFATSYKEKKVADAEQSLLAKFLPFKPDKPLEGPLGVLVTFRFTRPKSHTKKQRKSIAKTTKPDLDNAEKLLFDAISGVAFLNDKQIWKKESSKTWCDDNIEPGIILCIYETDPLNGEDRGH